MISLSGLDYRRGENIRTALSELFGHELFGHDVFLVELTDALPTLFCGA